MKPSKCLSCGSLFKPVENASSSLCAACHDSETLAAAPQNLLGLGIRDEPPERERREVPSAIGRYQIVRILGSGSFGTVFEAHDPNLERTVAVKRIHTHCLHFLESLEDWFAEARVLAGIQHPGIVKVYDAETDTDGRVYMVSEYIDGEPLSNRLKEDRLSTDEAIDLICQVAEAANAAHLCGLVHRDIKPGNVMVGADQRVLLIDFGIALSKRFQFSPLASGLIGTPQYMSPEQTRSEGHLVDLRSDIFSLGTVLFEMLTGRQLFAADSMEETIARVQDPSRRLFLPNDPPLPESIRRICRKCLEVRAVDRYQNASELLGDLRPVQARYLSRKQRDSGVLDETHIEAEARLVPRGFRSFDFTDADAFRQLLPGPFDGNGNPECLRFWLQRILPDSGQSLPFRIGLLYGPSGSGKSSLVKAGILPQLGDAVEAIFVESTRQQTCDNLVSALQEHLGTAEEDPVLLVGALRARATVEAPKRKTLLVFDQFEQWLHSRESGNLDGHELVNALRQCDGIHTQAILILRDDYWIPVSRLMNDLDSEIQTDLNARFVELFPLDHGAKVLELLGRAHGIIPEGTLNPDTARFIQRAVELLAVDDRVAPIHLTFFVEMFKKRPWTPDELKRVGGIQGLGIAFLDQQFSQGGADPRLRLHAPAVRGIFQKLLPSEGDRIKGGVCSEATLLEASGYQDAPEQFEQLLTILDSELKLITPISALGRIDAVGEDSPRGYQLTHDFLVPVVDEWLHRQKMESIHGRSELRLQELARSFQHQPESRHLPSSREWLTIRCFTSPSSWSSAEKQVMRRGGRRLLLHSSLAALAITALFMLGVFLPQRRVESELVSQVITTPTADVAPLIERLTPLTSSSRPLVRELFEETNLSQESRTNLALLLLGESEEADRLVLKRLQSGGPDEIRLIAAEIEREQIRETFLPDLWAVLEDPAQSRALQLRAASALSLLAPEDGQWAENTDRVLGLLLALAPSQATIWAPSLKPIAGRLTDQLDREFGELGLQLDGTTPASQLSAAALLARLLEDHPGKLQDLIDRASEHQLEILLPQIYQNQPALRVTLKERLSSEEEVDAGSAQRRAKAIALLAHLDNRPAHLFDSFAQKDALVVNEYLVRILEHCQVAPGQLAAGLDLDQPAPTLRFSLLSLGFYPLSQVPPDLREQLAGPLGAVIRHPHAGVHSTAEWLLHRWGKDPEELGTPDFSLGGSNRSWQPGPNGHRLVRFEPESLAPFSLAITETTASQFRSFSGEAQSSTPAHPAKNIALYDIMAYCNWLSRTEGVPEDQWCYQLTGKTTVNGLAEYRPFPDHLLRRGYRLPTKEEWILALTQPGFRSPGEALRFAGAWHMENSGGVPRPVKGRHPNHNGLFDLIGNMEEWTFTPSESVFQSYQLLGGSFDLPNFPKYTSQGRGYPADLPGERISFRIARSEHPD